MAYYLRPRKNSLTNGLSDNDKGIQCNLKEPIFEDDYLFCFNCSTAWQGECPQHPPLILRKDISFANYEGDETRTIKTAPDQVEVIDFGDKDKQTTVLARESISVGTRFGPYEGVVIPGDNISRKKRGWLVRRSDELKQFIDASNPVLSNWMRYVKSAGKFGEHNLEAFQLKGGIHYRCIRPIHPGDELLVWYGDTDGEQMTADSATTTGKKLQEILERSIAVQENSKGTQTFQESKGIRSSQQDGSQSADNFVAGSGDNGQRESRDTPDEILNERSILDEPSCDKTSTESTICQLPRYTEKKFCCRDCTAVFSSKDEFEMHFRTHGNGKPFLCSVCSKGFANISSLISHLWSHADAKACQCKQFACSVCTKKFSTKKALADHGKMHKEKLPTIDSKSLSHEKERYQSLTHKSGKSFAWQTNKRLRLTENLAKHQRRFLFGDEDVSIDRCSPRGFVKKHLKVQDDKPKHLVCKHCNERFSKRSHYRNHVGTHAVGTWVECPESKPRFKTSGLRKHVISHGKEKPRKCRLTNRGDSFAFASQLKLCSKLHSRNKLSSCSKWSDGKLPENHEKSN